MFYYNILVPGVYMYMYMHVYYCNNVSCPPHCLGSSHSAVAHDVVTEHAQTEAAAATPPARAVKDTFNSQDVSVL